MRNVLTILTLCVLTLTTSSVFAESYDESKRTERMGLSFYDGAPMYLLYFRRPDPLPPGSSFRDPIPGATMQVERLRSGERIEERDGYNVALGIVADKDSGSTATFISYAYDDAGNLVPMESGTTISNTVWIQSLFREQGPGLLAMASVGDVGISTFDSISERSRNWLLPVFGFALAFWGVRYCYRLVTRMAKGENGVGLGGASSDSEPSSNVGDGAFSTDFVRTSTGAKSDNAWENTDVSSADEYATGEAFGQKYSPKVVASNVDLQNEWARLSDDERSELLGDVLGGSPFGDRRGAWGDEEDER